MIVFSSHLAKINRVFVITNFKSNLHKSFFFKNSGNSKKTNRPVSKYDPKLDKKDVRDRLSKMAFISLTEPKVNLKNTPPKQEEIKKYEEDLNKKNSIEYSPSFSFNFSAQSSVNSNQIIKKVKENVKRDESDEIFEKELKEKAETLAKIVENDETKQSETAKLLLGKMDYIDRVKNKLGKMPSSLSEATMEQMKINESELLKNISENEEKFDIDENSVIERPQSAKNNFWTESSYYISQKLNSGNGLSIFNIIKPSIKTHESPLWSIHYDNELKQAQEIPPLNGFDELINLTNQGKLWKFPIDNEQDVDESDAQIPFHEHVFLDHYLEEFPQIEPIQNFMILALNGLSRNSFLSIKEKKEIIDWYKSYFNDRMDIIKEALEAERLEASYRESIENK